jgi:Uncharacterized protein conserved in bacteria (DUF2252)
LAILAAVTALPSWRPGVRKRRRGDDESFSRVRLLAEPAPLRSRCLSNPPHVAAPQECGWTLARAHARSGDRIAIASYLGNSDSFDRAIVEFSEAYADQNDRDYQKLSEAVKSGRIKAETGV